MTLTQLNYLITIAETKSLNKAAEQLYVSQPSLTNAIKELEKEFSISLFARTKNWKRNWALRYSIEAGEALP